MFGLSKKKEPEKPKRPQWGVHLGDGTAIISVDDNANVVIELAENPDAPPILLEHAPAAQLGVTLVAASKLAEVVKLELEKKKADEKAAELAKADVVR